MLFFQLNHYPPTAEGQNDNLTWMDYKFIYEPRKRCLGFSIGPPLREI